MAILLFFCGVSAPVRGNTPQLYNPFPEDEAPPALIDLDRTDADVELYVLGSWLARSTVATGIAFHPALPDSGDRVTFPFPYPGFETELFSQTLDVVLSLWLYNRYFFEAGFADDSDEDTFAAGYAAVEDELVQEFVIGNVPLTVDRYPYQYSGAPGARAGRTPVPGAVLRLQTARTYHELLMQLENSRSERRRFVQGGSLEEIRLRPEDYQRRGVYVLPHAPVRNVRVLVRDSGGSVELSNGTRSDMFRVLDSGAGDYVIDTFTGVVRLAERIPGGVPIAVTYEPAAEPGAVTALDTDRTPTDRTVPFPLTGTATEFEDPATGGYGPIEEYRVTVTAGSGAGSRGVMLEEPGRYSPFAAANHYRIPEDARAAIRDGTARIRIVRRGTRTPVEEEAAFLLEPVADGSLLQILLRRGGDTRGPRPAPADLEWKYPFAGFTPAARHAFMYGPRSHGSENLSTVDILLEYVTRDTGMQIDGDIVPGTVQITRNGRPVPGSEVNYGTGEITLPDRAEADGEIDVRYRVYTPEPGIGDIVAITGNRWRITDSVLLSLAAGIRWSVTDDTYSREMDEHPGRITTSLGVDIERRNFSLDAAAALQVYQPDTTGFLRLFGGEPEQLVLAPRDTTLFPASIPRDGSLPEGAAPFREEKRAIAPYRDYWTRRSGHDGSLDPYTRQVSPDPDREGARMGPYLAGSTDGAQSGTIGVLEWPELSPGEWVGATVRGPSSPVNARDARRISVTYRYIPDVDSDEGTATELIIQIGALEEDLDGNGIASRGRSAVDPAFEFFFPPGHPSAGAVRRVGQDAPGLAAPHREDPRGDGILLRERPESVFTIYGGSIDTSRQWRTQEITLSREEAEKLGEVRGARILVRNKNPDSSDETIPAGRLLLGDLTIKRGGNATVIAGRERSATASISSDPALGRADEQTLREGRDVVRTRFNPDEADQPVMELAWTDAGNTSADQSTVEAEFSIPDFSPAQYGSLVFFLYLTDGDGRAGAAPAESVTVSLLPHAGAPEADSLIVEIPAELLYDQGGSAGGRWREVRVNLDSGAVHVDGSAGGGAGSAGAVPAARLPRDGQALLRVGSVRVEGITDAGALYFDELHAADPNAGTAAAARIDVSWHTDVAGGTLILGQGLAARTPGFQGDESIGTASGRSSAVYRYGRFLLGGDASYRMIDDQDATFAAGHSVTLPVGPAEPLGLVLEEEFYRDFDPRAPVATRQTGFSLGSPRLGRYRYTHNHRINTRDLLLRWNGIVAPPAAGPVAVTVQGSAELVDLDRKIESGYYGDSWTDTNRYILPPGPSGSDSRQERRLEGNTQLDLHQLELILTGESQNRSDTAGTQESMSRMTAAIPFHFEPPGRRPWSLTPGYSRRWRVTDRRESDSFPSDFRIWSKAVGEEPVVFAAIPLAELFQPPDRIGTGLPKLEPPREGRSYESDARMRFSRAFASRPRDLWVPSDAEALIRRSTRWEADSLTDRRTWQLSLTAVAINLFGTQGSTPLFLRYRSDEFRNRLLLSLTEDELGQPDRWGIEFRNDTVLLGFSDNELSLSSSANFRGGDRYMTDLEGRLAYQWRRPGYPDVRIFERIDPPPFYRHTESIRGKASFDDDDLAGAEIAIGHESALVAGSNGEIRVFVDLGWIVDPAEYEDGALHIMGIQAGIEGVLRY